MVFSGLTCLLLFLPIVFLLYFAGSNINWRNGVLLVASLIFYAWGEPIWVLAMIGSTVINYLCAILITSCKSSALKKISLTLGVIASVAMLFYFKYAAFLFNSFSGLLGISAKLPVLALPIGISFYTFQILTYTVDVYRGKSPCMYNFPKLMLYISCFPQLIAGPIVQYSDISASLSERTTTVDNFVNGMRKFAVGLSKKVLIANVCGIALEQLPLATETANLSLVGAWYAAALYSLQLYFDFSGYSDMAIGLGGVFGFKYKENFNYPYISRSVTEFWRRWHISLGSFFRDYVYIPLGGNRCGNLRTILNLLVVWALTGLWHGANWNFVLWGAYYGVLLILERFVFAKVLKRLPGAVTLPTTLIWVMFGWVIFDYTDITAVGKHLLSMVGMNIGADGLSGAALIDDVTLAVIRKYTILPLLAAVACTPIVPKVKEIIEDRHPVLFNLAGNVAYVVEIVTSLLFVIGQSYNPFIYFRF